MDGVSKACHEVRWKKRGRSNGETCRWYEEVKEADKRKKDAHKAMCLNSTEGNKSRHRSMNSKS